jgi:hypothetical protein
MACQEKAISLIIMVAMWRGPLQISNAAMLFGVLNSWRNAMAPAMLHTRLVPSMANSDSPP